MNEEPSSRDLVELAAELTIAWLSNPNSRAVAGEASDFLKSMHATLTRLDVDDVLEGTGAADNGEGAGMYLPAVPVRASLASKDHIISLIDGKAYKALRRHLSSHGLTPEQYRRRYNLKPDYPMVAPSHSEARRRVAKKIGLGRIGREVGQG